MLNVIKKGDVILIVLFLLIGTAAYLLGISRDSGQRVSIYIQGQLYASYSLLENREIDLPTGNEVTIEDGFVWMSQAPCQEQSCVHQGKINQRGQTILCLPQQVIIEISGENNEVDAVVQ